VATPIGNLEDITHRALRILGEVRLVAAEDTRHTRKLLNHYSIACRLTSYHEHNKRSKLKVLLAELEQGDIALVSDAGTPGLNDPGYELVQAALEAGHAVSPIPGACAPIAALVASGLPTNSFLYLGYLPRKASQRLRFLQAILNVPYTLIFLETPHRLLATLDSLCDVLGNREIAIARELTKVHEEIYRGTIQDAREHFINQEPRGEFTLIVAGSTQKQRSWSEKKLRSVLQKQLTSEVPTSKIASQVATQSGWKRRDVYQILSELIKHP